MPWHFPRPPRTRAGVPGRTHAAVRTATRPRQRDVATAATPVTRLTDRAGPQLIALPSKPPTLGPSGGSIPFLLHRSSKHEHDPKTHSGCRASAASAGDGLVLGGSPVAARAWRSSIARSDAAVLVPRGRGRPPRVVVLQRPHA